jgi:hypothetical protein
MEEGTMWTRREEGRRWGKRGGEREGRRSIVHWRRGGVLLGEEDTKICTCERRKEREIWEPSR